MSKNRIIYFGTAQFAVPALERLLSHQDHFEIVAVVTQPDRPVGRHGVIQQSPVAECARGRNLLVLTPESLKDVEVQESLVLLKPDLFVVAAYGKILPQAVLAIPRHGSLNLHGSLLPKYRGASPIQMAILEGEAETGVTLMVMDDKMDHGPLIAKSQLTIASDDTHDTLEKRLGVVAADLLLENLELFLSGTKKPMEQDHAAATFTKILSRDNGTIDWGQEDAARIERKLRAFDPWPGAYAVWNRGGKPLRIKFIRMRVADETNGAAPGTVFVSLDGTPAVQTTKGALLLLEVQLEGKKAAAGADFINGYKDFVTSSLS